MRVSTVKPRPTPYSPPSIGEMVLQLGHKIYSASATQKMVGCLSHTTQTVGTKQSRATARMVSLALRSGLRVNRDSCKGVSTSKAECQRSDCSCWHSFQRVRDFAAVRGLAGLDGRSRSGVDRFNLECILVLCTARCSFMLAI